MECYYPDVENFTRSCAIKEAALLPGKYDHIVEGEALTQKPTSFVMLQLKMLHLQSGSNSGNRIDNKYEMLLYLI